jgi:hypothetical protein
LQRHISEAITPCRQSSPTPPGERTPHFVIVDDYNEAILPTVWLDPDDESHEFILSHYHPPGKLGNFHRLYSAITTTTLLLLSTSFIEV